MLPASDSTSFFSRTCTPFQASTYCANVTVRLELVSGRTDFPSWFLAAAFDPETYTAPVHPTAFALFLPREVPFAEPWTAPSGWISGGLTSMPGYMLLAGQQAGPVDHWYISGNGYSGDENIWLLPSSVDLSGMTWSWRGETEDGASFECFQGPAETCLTLTTPEAREASIVTPEPATWSLLLGGMLALFWLRRRLAY